MHSPLGISEPAKIADETAVSLEPFFELSPDMLCIAGYDGYFERVNPAWGKILGYSSAELLGRPYLELIHSEDRTATAAEVQKLKQGHQVVGFETRCRCKDGTYRWLNWNATAYPERQQLYCTIRDVTAEKATYQTLEQSLYQLIEFKAALDQSAIVAITDPAGVIIEVNNRFCELSQYTRNELIGQTHQLVNSGYHPKLFFRQMWALISQGKVWHGQIKNRAKDGTFYWVETTIVPLLDTRGKPERYLSIRFEITHQKHVEEALRTSESTKRALLNAIPELLIHMRSDGTYLDLLKNSEFNLINPYESVIGANVYSILPPDLAQQRMEYTRTALSTRQLQVYEQQILISEEVCYEEVRIAPMGPDQVLIMVRDITQRRQNEERLRLLESAVVHANDAILICEGEPVEEPGPQIVYVNEAFTRMTGYTLAEVYGKTPRILQGAKTDQAALQKIRSALAAWQPVRAELINYRKDGTEFWVELAIEPIADETGYYTHWVSVQREMTQRKREEQENRQLAIALENAVEGISFIDPQGYYMTLNPAYASICGYEPSELLGKSWERMVHPDDLEQLRAAYQQMLTTGKVEAEARGVRKDGTAYYKQVFMICAYDENDQFLGHYCFMRDITARKESAIQLRESQHRYATLAKTAPVGIFRTDAEGNCIYVNDVWCQLSGLNPDDAMMQGWVKAVHPDDRSGVSTQWNVAVQTHQPFAAEYRLQQPDGTHIWVYGQAVAETSIDGEIIGYLGTLTDITERIKAEEVSCALEREKELSSLKLRFFSMASHEFRTPLSIILMASQVLEEVAPSGVDSQTLRNIYRIQDAAKHLRQMLTDMLTLARIEAHQVTFQPRPIQVRSVCELILEDLKSSLGKRPPVEFVYQGDEARVELDEKLLKAILTNLLANAIKYSPEHTLTRLKVIQQAELLQIIVQDQGIGIAPADHALLFEAFHRGKNVGKVEGTGLGLAIVKKAVDLHKGTITFKSTLDQGTTFTVHLPAESQLTSPSLNLI